MNCPDRALRSGLFRFGRGVAASRADEQRRAGAQPACSSPHVVGRPRRRPRYRPTWQPRRLGTRHAAATRAVSDQVPLPCSDPVSLHVPVTIPELIVPPNVLVPWMECAGYRMVKVTAFPDTVPDIAALYG